MKGVLLALLLTILPVASYAQKMPENCKPTEQVVETLNKSDMKLAFTGFISLQEKKLTTIYVNEEHHAFLQFMVNGSIMCQVGGGQEGYMLWTNSPKSKQAPDSDK